MSDENREEIEDLMKNLRESILDEQKRLKFNEIDLISSEGGIALRILIKFLSEEEYKVDCTQIDDFFSLLTVIDDFMEIDVIVPHIHCEFPQSLKNNILNLNVPSYQQFFENKIILFAVFIYILEKYLKSFQLIDALSKFSNLKELLKESKTLSLEINNNAFLILPVLKKNLTTCIKKKNQKYYKKSIEVIYNTREFFPSIYKKIKDTYHINEFITLKLENDQTNIYVGGRIFNQCKFLFINLSMDKVREYDTINSIDEAEAALDNSLEGGGAYRYDISAETEFWGHCSNLEAWAENNYDTRLLHRNLAFPLLRRLTEVGDPQAKRVFKEEILNRVLTGYPNVIRYLSQMGYFRHLRDLDYEKVIESSNADIIENFIRVLGSNTRGVSFHIKKILQRFRELSNKAFKEKIVELLKNLDVELYKGFQKSRLLKDLNKNLIKELVHDPHSILKEFYYHFRDSEYFLNSKLALDLSNQSIKEIEEIKGISRLKHLIKLDLSNNNISKIQGLEHLENLSILKLGNNPLNKSLIDDLGGLDHNGYANKPEKFVDYCKKHPLPSSEHVRRNGIDYEIINKTLLIRNAEITNLNEIEGLFKLKELEYLDLCNNLLTSLKGIHKLENLRILDVRNNYLRDICDVEKLKHLEILRAHGNGIYDIGSTENLKKLRIVDLDSHRLINDREYLGYLLESFTVKEIHGLCKVFKIRGYSKYKRADLINFIKMSPSKVTIREIIYSIESKVIFPPIKKAINHIKYMKNINNIHIHMLSHNHLRVEIHRKRKTIEIEIRFLDHSIKNPERTCSCKIGKNQGFCKHFWYGFIFAVKKEMFDLRDWTLTILPQKLESALKTIKIEKIRENEYRFANRNCILYY